MTKLKKILATKVDVLEFIYDREAVTADDLMEQFGYTYSGAHSRLSQLSKQGLIQQVTGGRWCLTEKAYNKLDYHGVIKRKEDEQERIKRQAEGRVWYIGNGRIRTANLDDELIKRLRNPRTCSAAILELEIGGCFSQARYPVELYPTIAEGRPELKVTVGDLDIYIEVVHLAWPIGERFLAPQKSQGRRMVEKILRKYDQLPDQGPGVIVANPPHFLAPDTSGGIAERLKGLLKPDLHTRVSALILASKWAERSGFIKPFPIVIINGHAKRRCDEEVSKLADALVKYPDWW